MCVWGGGGGGYCFPKQKGSNEPFRTLAAILFQIFALKKEEEEEGEEKKKEEKKIFSVIFTLFKVFQI